MSEKRRDSKGRILRTGESQRKDGRYAYKYTDACGKTQFVYAWKLVPTDKTPTGKRDDISLREKVKEILRDTERWDRHHRQEDDGLPALRPAEQPSEECQAEYREGPGIPDVRSERGPPGVPKH